MRHTRNRQVALSRKVNYFVKGNNMKMEDMQKFHSKVDKSFIWIRTKAYKNYPVRNYYGFNGDMFLRKVNH